MKGEFYWRQFAIFKELGIRTVFVGMFDEVDEGTAIYKVADQTPVGKHFVTYEGLPTDWYLKLTGAATRMIRGDVAALAEDPGRDAFSQGLTKAQRHERRHSPLSHVGGSPRFCSSRPSANSSNTKGAGYTPFEGEKTAWHGGFDRYDS